MTGKTGNIRFGTCSWKYDSWAGLVYSRSRPENYLREYARHFSTVEIDQWFWSLFGLDKIALPSPATAREYAESVPEDFRFTIKVPNSLSLTHFYRQNSGDPLVENPYFLSPELFNQFLESIDPLRDKTAALMFQFEYLNRQKMAGLPAFLDRFARFLRQADPGLPLALEIRNPNYLKHPYFRFLRENNLIPVFLQGYFMPPVWDVYRQYREEVTQKRVILRLHGPDRSRIEAKSAGKWNRILEPKDEELPKIAGMLKEFLARQQDVYVNVNNHYEGSAPLSIRRLQKMIQNTEIQ